MNFIQNESKQKLRGGYYTPLDLAVFLARWVREINPKDILEPSCGDGVFLKAFEHIEGFKKSNITAFEIDPEEASKARSATKQLPQSKIYAEDFLQWVIESFNNKQIRFDAIVGNPPFIRYQYLPKDFQIKAEKIFQELKIPFTKHTNAWVTFILASIALLKPGGRLAMIVPAEIIHIPHAQALRAYLGIECRRLVVIDPEELWFDNTLQGAMMLLAEKKHHALDKAEGLGTYSVKGRQFLTSDPSKIFSDSKAINGKTVQGKWTRAFLDFNTRSLLDELAEHPQVHKFIDIADVDVGIVTGANEYFLVPNDVVKHFNLSDWAHPMFGRSEHCPGIIYDKKQHEANIESGKPTNFIWFPKGAIKNASAQSYIKYGEQQELHTRYKCSIRTPWYSVPSVYSTEIGLLKRAHNIPRLILNKIGAYTTDTAYRIRSKIPAEKLVGNFINSLTALSAEIEGRYYGGGVLELVPSEIEHLYIPIPHKANISLEQLDNAIRNLPIDQVLEEQDNTILGALNLTKEQQALLNNGWKKLRDRRQRISSDTV